MIHLSIKKNGRNAASEVFGLSRAFVKEDDGEHGSIVSDIRYREKKTAWLKIQEKKLDVLLNDPKSKKIEPQTLERWIRETREDIARTRQELGYDE